MKTASGSVSECAVNTYPAKLVGALHTAHLYISILSSRDNLHTLKVTSQDHYIATGAIGLEKKGTWGGPKSDQAIINKLNQTTETKHGQYHCKIHALNNVWKTLSPIY